jgi:hypothetical protein
LTQAAAINLPAEYSTMPSPLDQPEQPTPTENGANDANTQVEADQPPQPLAIEFGEATQTATDDEVQKLDLGQGDVVKLDALGPMIINTDGVSGVLCFSLSFLTDC